MRCVTFAFCLLWAYAHLGRADTLIVLDDGEGQGVSWRHAQIVNSPVHSGEHALRWNVGEHPSLDSPSFISDWGAFDELRFWAFLEAPVDFRIPIVFGSEGGYFITDWRLDWSGWKEHRIRLSECRRAHSPAGWHDIRSFGFRAAGYGQGPVPKDLSLVFDDFALHSPQNLPERNLNALILKERRLKMERLKARGNPYFLSVLDSLKDVRPKPTLPQKLTSAWQFAGRATDALAMAWAASWDESPRKGDATLISHASALIDFCLSEQKQGSWFYSRKWESGDPNSDRFALGPLMDAIYWLRRLPAGEAKWTQWEAPLKQLVEFQYTRWGRYKQLGFTNNEAWGSAAGAYPNQDVFHLMEMTLAYHFWKEPKYLESVDETLKGLEAHLLPDGGFNYIGPETEIPCYHDLNILWLARYYHFTKDERARDLLARTVNYYPLTYSNEGRPEYYTDCWWKHYWADGSPCGPEIIAGLTGDAHNKWLADQLLARVGTGAGRTYGNIYAGLFYRSDVQPAPLPDNYVRLDRNIRGPRGRFGTWYFAATPGGGARDTFVGAMVSEPGRPEAINGAFLAANIEIALRRQGRRDQTHLYISGPDDITNMALGPDSAAFGARYSPRQPYINSRPNPEVPRTPWVATQVWLLTRYGLVGLVELEATQEQAVPYLGGELRFGPIQPLTQEKDTGLFRCGALTIRLLEHNFAHMDFGPARPGYAQTSTTHSALILRTGGEQFTARPGSPVRYAAFIAPQGTPGLQDYKRLDAEGIWGFALGFAGRPFAVLFNPSNGPAQAKIAWPLREASVYGPENRRETTAAVNGELCLRLNAKTILLVTQ